jgi:hypothetical protein
MQKNSPSKGTFISLAIIVAVALLLYFYTKGEPSDASISSLSSETSEESASAQEASNRVITLLNKINSLNIDTEFFASPAYKSLVDYTIAIPDQPVGRTNPFAPVGVTR